jgi:AcrR family transcriptional regulator
VKADGAATRPYTNSLREEQAAQTRSRILEATVALLAESGEGDVAMPEVAARAGVSLRTVYRNFPTRDALLDGVAEWITAQFAARMSVFPTTADGYEALIAQLPLVFELEPLYRALFASAPGRAAHARSNVDRGQMIQRAFASELQGMGAVQRRRFAAVMHLVGSSNGALFLKDYAGLSPRDIVRAMGWASRVLAEAAADPDNRKEL